MMLRAYITERRFSVIAILALQGMFMLTLTPALGQGAINLQNLNHQYSLDPEISLQHRVIEYEPNIRLLLKLTIRESRTRLSDIKAHYGFMETYEEDAISLSDSLDLNETWKFNEGTNHYFDFSISNPDQKKFLVIKLENQATKNDFYFDLNVKVDPVKMSSGLVLYNPTNGMPIFESYLRQGQNIVIKNFKSTDTRLTIFRYSSEFPSADPPFAVTDDDVAQVLEIDSSFTVAVDSAFQIASTGLYFAQIDTTGVNGLTFRIEDEYFPKKATYAELIETLKYFSTTSELSKLQKADNQRTSFDEFWINATKSATRGRRVIRDYYRNVADANRLFTTYKQGWKTDQGMIYIIFGKPDEVTRTDGQEEWVYYRTQQMPRISFTFVQVSSFFTDKHSVLLRKKSYQQAWYKAIDLWRKGQKGA